MQVERLFDLLREKSLLLTHPSMWKDPYELISTRRVVKATPSSNFFASCWTTRFSDEPFWRLFGENTKDVVRIRSTPEKLLALLTKSTEKEIDRAYLGRVRYLRHKELDDRISRNAPQDELIFCKRAAFRFEKEFRFACMSKRSHVEAIKIPFSPSCVIDQVMLGPGNCNSTSHYMGKLIELGVARKKVKFSKLYSSPDFY